MIVIQESDVEFDYVAWCCEWSEYESFVSAYQALTNNNNTDNQTAKAWFEERTTVIEFEGGVLININF